MNKLFLHKYLNSFTDIIGDQKQTQSILEISKILKKMNKKNKVMIFGNGGSAAIASHFSVDLTKNTNIKCLNLNEHSLITCFANDYGYEKWVEKSIYFYGEKGDVLIIISSSGQSKNILNGVRAAKKKGFAKIITLSGFKVNNPLKKMGDLNIWVDSKIYNIVENAHQYLLLTCIDLINHKKIKLK
ncbi:MAG: phosphoheptose isomerase [Euryarchaeota archaeon]|nr:phosphoheptose isomerase [Euryarchaeota archaeon]OUU12194.1 MAG: phosphoheptose isomerase [Gammaproteobacteria bacterium TMED34]